MTLHQLVAAVDRHDLLIVVGVAAMAIGGAHYSPALSFLLAGGACFCIGLAGAVVRLRR